MSASSFLAAAGEPGALKRWLSSLVPARDTRQRLNRIFDAEDLVVFASPETGFLPLGGNGGLVVGRIFRGTDSPSPASSLTLAEVRQAAASKGRTLLAGSWGAYVAFLRSGRAVSVLRDPSGAVPAYCFETAGIELYFSAPDLIEDLGLSGFAIDEEFLRQWLSFPFLRTARTGLEGCTELLPGTVRTSGPAGVTVEAAWTPWPAVSRDRRLLDFDEAAGRLREVALATVPAQLSEIDCPVLELSGGLDSSIVAACLAQAGRSFRACTFATVLPDGDERTYARQVADAAGIELAELIEDALPLDLSPPARRTLRPPLSPVLQPLRRALARHAREAHASDFVTGAGGDNLFCYLTTAAPVLDAASDRGFSAALDSLQDVAAIAGCSVWRVGRIALRKRLRQRRRPLWKATRQFLAPDAVAQEPDPHPWLARPSGVPRGKIEHVESLVRVQHFVEPLYPSGEAVHHPLLNQPLMELCLSIPTWLWVKGGRNRSVARAAFAGLLPPEIIHRRTKGRLESMCARAYSANRDALAAILLDGELARRRLLDRAVLERYLKISGQGPDEFFYRLFDLVSLELWVRSWRA